MREPIFWVEPSYWHWSFWRLDAGIQFLRGIDHRCFELSAGLQPLLGIQANWAIRRHFWVQLVLTLGWWDFCVDWPRPKEVEPPSVPK